MRIRLPFAFGFLIILLLASSAGLLPHSALPQTPEAAKPYLPQQSDKVLHFLTFFALTAAFYFIFDTSRRRVLNLTLIVCTLVLAVGSEVAQGLLPNDREFDPWDVLANVLGSVGAVGLAGTYHRRSAERRRRARYSAVTGEGLPEDDDLELGEGAGIASTSAGERETGVVSMDGSTTAHAQTVEQELDNWDENQPDDWSEDEHATTNDGTNAKMTPATSSAGSHEEPRQKVAVD